jgi:EAL domain-containing protein (putative c-di-GMP-specific phosphodiesterase class I)
VIDCTTGRMESVTAEMLWQHPLHGPVLADEFLPLAETAGLIGAIGEWALDRSCSALAAWKEAPDRPKCCSLPVGHAELSGGCLATLVLSKTEAAGLDPSQIRLRVNTAVLAHNSTIVARELELLLENGIHLEIENYGDPGLPDVDIAKMRGQWLSLSPALVQGAQPSGRAVAARPSPLHAIAAKAKELEMRVIATGIRSAPQLERARSCGADFVKGDFIAPPLSVHELGDGGRFTSRSGIGSRRASSPGIP